MDVIVPFDQLGVANPGPWTNASPQAGIKGSIVNANFFPAVQDEILNVQDEASLTRDGTNHAQLLQAIRSGKLTFFADTGTADALVITPRTSFPNFAAGLELTIWKNPQVGANATATPKLSSGALSMTLVKEDGSALTPGDLKAGGFFTCRSDGTALRVRGLRKSDAQTLYGATSKGGLAKDDANNFLLAYANLVADNRAQPVGGDLLALDRVADGAMVSVSAAALAAYILSTIVATKTFKIKLPGNLTVYVRADGSDSNNGLTNSPSGAFKTIQGAWNAIFNLYDAAGFTITIQLAHAAGETVSTFANASFTGYAGSVVLQGDASNQAAFIVNCGTAGSTVIINSNIQTLSLVGLTLDFSYNGATGSEVCVASTSGSIVYVTSCTYNCANNRPNLVENYASGGQIIFAALTTITVSGAGTRKTFALTSGSGSSIQASNGPVSTYIQSTGTITYTDAFAVAANQSSQNYNQGVFSNFSASSSTRKFDISGGGNIAMGGNPNFLPGGAAGVCTNNLNGYS